MAALNLLVQIIGICAGIYLAFSRSIAQGIALVAVIGTSHFALTRLSNWLMLVHQRLLPEEELHELQLRAQLGGGVGAAPAAWGQIATVCGLLYFCIAVGTIWLFVSA